MYLINSTTFKLKQFVSENNISYAILSHRWEDGEVLFEDASNLSTCSKAGLAKVRACCKVARERGFEWVWIDTCCIDKKSSAELSEAINSMFNYYKRAALCIAYLSDVHSGATISSFRQEFEESRWLCRSWTLQELIAPASRALIFFNHSWDELASKHELAYLISDATRIDVVALKDGNIFQYSVAERMSWAADRIATREEDVAYSLMGIFDVNMPMLYGEGSKAFGRLQEEILKQSDDETIFAWDCGSNAKADFHSGLLAPNPSVFGTCRFLKATTLHPRGKAPISTNRGVEIECWFMTIAVSFTDTNHTATERVLCALLNASFRKPGENEQFVGIYLRPVSNLARAYVRIVMPGRDKLLHRWEGQFSPHFFPPAGSIVVRADPHIGWRPERTSSFSLNSLVGPVNRTALYTMKHNRTVIQQLLKSIKTLSPYINEHDMKAVYEGSHFQCLRVPSRYVKPTSGMAWVTNDISSVPAVLQAVQNWSHGPICNILIQDSRSQVSLLHLGINEQARPVCIVLNQMHLNQAKHRGKYAGKGKCQIQDRGYLCDATIVQDVLALKLAYTSIVWTPFKPKSGSFTPGNGATSVPLVHQIASDGQSCKDNTQMDTETGLRMSSSVSVGCRKENEQKYGGYCAIQHENQLSSTRKGYGQRYFYHFLDTVDSQEHKSQTGWSLMLRDFCVGNKLFWHISLCRWEQPLVTSDLSFYYNSQSLGVTRAISESLKSLIELSLDSLHSETEPIVSNTHFWADFGMMASPGSFPNLI